VYPYMDYWETPEFLIIARLKKFFRDNIMYVWSQAYASLPVTYHKVKWQCSSSIIIMLKTTCPAYTAHKKSKNSAMFTFNIKHNIKTTWFSVVQTWPLVRYNVQHNKLYRSYRGITYAALLIIYFPFPRTLHSFIEHTYIRLQNWLFSVRKCWWMAW